MTPTRRAGSSASLRRCGTTPYAQNSFRDVYWVIQSTGVKERFHTEANPPDRMVPTTDAKTMTMQTQSEITVSNKYG